MKGKKVKPQKTKGSYEDPKSRGALGGVQRFARARNLSEKKAKILLEKQLPYTLHKPVRRKFQTLPVLVFNRDQQWVADLVEMQKVSRYNNGVRYLLTVIDVLSKYAWVVPLKNKTGKEVVKAFERILKTSQRKPQNLQTDKGKEFYNGLMQQWLKKEGIYHFSTEGDAKASVVERFNRTLKGRMYRYFTAANTMKYVNVLQDLVNQYNADRHRSIGMAPQDVTIQNERQVWQTLYGKRLRKIQKHGDLREGDRVRLSERIRPFKKGYLPQWTEEVFAVKKVVPGPVLTYKIEELDGTPLKGTFYKEDLQKVVIDDETMWRVEKVLKRRGKQALVRWKGWPSKYDSWIPQSDLTSWKKLT